MLYFTFRARFSYKASVCKSLLKATCSVLVRSTTAKWPLQLAVTKYDLLHANKAAFRYGCPLIADGLLWLIVTARLLFLLTFNPKETEKFHEH